MKTSENQMFYVFTGYRNGTFGLKWVNMFLSVTTLKNNPLSSLTSWDILLLVTDKRRSCKGKDGSALSKHFC